MFLHMEEIQLILEHGYGIANREWYIQNDTSHETIFMVTPDREHMIKYGC
jgi:hypothetical protein